MGLLSDNVNSTMGFDMPETSTNMSSAPGAPSVPIGTTAPNQASPTSSSTGKTEEPGKGFDLAKIAGIAGSGLGGVAKGLLNRPAPHSVSLSPGNPMPNVAQYANMSAPQMGNPNIQMPGRPGPVSAPLSPPPMANLNYLPSPMAMSDYRVKMNIQKAHEETNAILNKIYNNIAAKKRK